MRKRDEEGDVCCFYQKCIKPVNHTFPSEDQIHEHEGGICFELCNVVLKKKEKRISVVLQDYSFKHLNLYVTNSYV